MALDNVFTQEMAILGHFKLSPIFFANFYFLFLKKCRNLRKWRSVTRTLKVKKKKCNGVVVERQTLNQEVLDSIPTGVTMFCP